MKRFLFIIAALFLIVIGTSFVFGESSYKQLSLRARSDKIQLIDVREPSEYAAGHADGAVNIPLGDLLKGDLSEIDKNKPVYVYCRTGKRAASAKIILEKAGYKDVTNLRGLTDWQTGGGMTCASTKPAC